MEAKLNIEQPIGYEDDEDIDPQCLNSDNLKLKTIPDDAEPRLLVLVKFPKKENSKNDKNKNTINFYYYWHQWPQDDLEISRGNITLTRYQIKELLGVCGCGLLLGGVQLEFKITAHHFCKVVLGQKEKPE